ncbi:unnamed protein product, partial [Owenia fusiformis]
TELLGRPVRAESDSLSLFPDKKSLYHLRTVLYLGAYCPKSPLTSEYVSCSVFLFSTIHCIKFLCFHFNNLLGESIFDMIFSQNPLFTFSSFHPENHLCQLKIVTINISLTVMSSRQ